MKTLNFNCLGCGAYTQRPSWGNYGGKYCSNQCQRDYQDKLKILDYLEGKEVGWSGKQRQLKPFLRRYLHTLRGTACQECGWDKKHPVDNLPLTEVDHIDGNAENCTLDNLKILCPNCHSLTPTFRARNKNSSRGKR